jgi:hypothetical protein
MYTQYPRYQPRSYDTPPQAITTEKEKNYPKQSPFRIPVNAPSVGQRSKDESAPYLSALSRLPEVRIPRHLPWYLQRRDMIENILTLQEGCDAVLGTRLKAHEQRGIVRRDRQVLSDIDARFMQEVRNYLFTSQDERLRRPLDLYEEMQTLRDEILPEGDYNILGDQLNSGESDLAETSGKLLSLLYGVGNGLLDYNGDGSVLEEDVTDLERVRSERGSTQRPEVREYLSRLGDRDLVRERLTELRHERAMLVEEEKSRARVGMVLNEGAQKFLDLFDVRHAELQQELAVVEDDLERLLDQTDKRRPIFFLNNLLCVNLQSHIFVSENSYTSLQRLDTPGPTYSPETNLQTKLVKHALDIEQSRTEGSKKARSRAAINKKNRHHKILPPAESFSDRSYQVPPEIWSLTQEYDLWGQEKLAAWKEGPGRAKDWKRCRLLKASKKGR